MAAPIAIMKKLPSRYSFLISFVLKPNTFINEIENADLSIITFIIKYITTTNISVEIITIIITILLI